MNNDIKYEDLKSIFTNNFSLSTLGSDFSSRVGLISLICYLYFKLKPKSPDLSYWSLVYKLGNGIVPENFLRGLSILCEDFGRNCYEFQTFGIEDKKIPSKIKEILSSWLPF